MDNFLHKWLSKYVRLDITSYKSSPIDLVVDMFISDKCNLKCKHCYYGNTQTIGSLLSKQDWEQIIKSLYSIGVRHFHISGRESSLDNRIVPIVSYLKSLDGTYAGLVSNGTGSLDFYKSLFNEGIDYLEFSIDGTENTHDFVRGNNVYSQVMNTLVNLSSFSDKIDVSTCLNKKSIDEYFTLIDICLSFGVRKFFATPFLASGNGEHFDSFSIEPSSFAQLINNSFSYLESKPEQKIALRYCVPHDLTFSMIKKDVLFEKLLVDYLLGKSELVYRINGNVMEISLDLLNVHYFHNLSITSDGEVLPCADYISDNNYPSISLGNIKDLDISALMKARADAINNTLKTISYGNY